MQCGLLEVLPQLLSGGTEEDLLQCGRTLGQKSDVHTDRAAFCRVMES